VYSITIGDSWYITVDNNGLHRSTPHAIDGRITEAIGNRSTSTKPISSFTKRHLAIPDATFLASDGFNQIERFSPKLIHTILRDTSIPTVLKMAMIATLSSLVFGINGDNSTSILVTLVPDEEPTETLK
jgi:serine/threonine protein phosphatase PrpC